MRFAEKVKMMCVKTGLSATDFIASLGYSRGAFSYWNKSGNMPDAEGVAKIAAALDMTV